MNYIILFIIGLLFGIIGRVLLAKGMSFMYPQKSIGFTH